jgi:hypothetical protein
MSRRPASNGPGLVPWPWQLRDERLTGLVQPDQPSSTSDMATAAVTGFVTDASANSVRSSTGSPGRTSPGVPLGDDLAPVPDAAAAAVTPALDDPPVDLRQRPLDRARSLRHRPLVRAPHLRRSTL